MKRGTAIGGIAWLAQSGNLSTDRASKEHEGNYDEVSVYWPGDELAGVDWAGGLVGRARCVGTSCGTEGIVPGAGNRWEVGAATGFRKSGVRGRLFLGGARRFPTPEGREKCDFRIRGRKGRKSIL